MITEEAEDARLARIAALKPAVRIYQLVERFDWWTWLCDACLKKWKTAGWMERAAKEPPHPLTCDECGRDDAKQQEPAQAA